VKDSFLVQPNSAGGWDTIAGALGRLLARLSIADVSHVVLIEIDDEHYAQALVNPDRNLWIEAVGPSHLRQGLDDSQHAEMLSLGWNPPDPDGRHGANYWKSWPNRTSEFAAAAMMITTFVAAFHAGSACPVAVEVFEAVPDARP
jgi:hypothetical protein